MNDLYEDSTALAAHPCLSIFRDNIVLDRVHPSGLGGTQTVYKFKNGYGASVVRAHGTFGADKGLYELAVVTDFLMKDDGDVLFDLAYDTPITNDVIGYLHEGEVAKILTQIGRLPDREIKSIPDVH